MPLGKGDVFAGYALVSLLGIGGMGEVYLAQHPRLPRQDALKILRADVSGDREFRLRFIREADLASALSHPNIVTVYDRGEFEGQLWIATEYVDGTDAAQLMRDRYPAGMPVEEASEIVTAIASALDYAHDQGLLHRDVKPANILLSRPNRDGQRRVFLADFGIARPLADPNGLTATNLTVGTVAYAAPEQLMGEDIDGRADEYALAATAFHLLTGGPMYEASNPVAVISKHLSAPAPAPSQRRPDLAPLDGVFATALAKNPPERFAACGQFAKAFGANVGVGSSSWQPTQAGMVAGSPLVHLSTDPPGDKSRRTRLRPVPLTIVALVAVGAIAAVVIQVINHRKPSAVAGPTLDGTYRLAYDLTKQTANGAPEPVQSHNDTRWWAFRSLCTSTGCMATGTQLDTKNPKVAHAPVITSDLHFADGHWQQTETPDRSQAEQARCLGVDGKVGPGSETVMVTRTLEPQADGTLRGVATTTALTNDCGDQGAVWQTPFVATRTSDTPTGVTVADPADVTAGSETTTAPAPSAAGAHLNGAYRIDYDFAHQTVNGSPTTGDRTNETHWWAFRSSCTATRCITTGAILADNNQQEPAGGGTVLEFTDGHWQNTPAPEAPQPCSTGKSTDSSTIGWSLQPQSDGTLQGTETMTVLTDECGDQGNVYKTPIVATRIGDVPPAVVLADPSLFL